MCVNRLFYKKMFTFKRKTIIYRPHSVKSLIPSVLCIGRVDTNESIWDSWVVMAINIHSC